jgi:hypothetical protein
MPCRPESPRKAPFKRTAHVATLDACFPPEHDWTLSMSKAGIAAALLSLSYRDRPALILSDYPGDDALALLIVFPHTMPVRASPPCRVGHTEPRWAGPEALPRPTSGVRCTTWRKRRCMSEAQRATRVPYRGAPQISPVLDFMKRPIVFPLSPPAPRYGRILETCEGEGPGLDSVARSLGFQGFRLAPPASRILD